MSSVLCRCIKILKTAVWGKNEFKSWSSRSPENMCNRDDTVYGGRHVAIAKVPQ